MPKKVNEEKDFQGRYLSDIWSFSDDEIEELGSVITEYKKLVEEFLEKNQGDDRWTKLQKFLNKNKKIISLNKRLKKVATQDKMAKLVGRANANSRFNNTLNPASFISALGATNQIRTSDGYEGVEHNKQYIEDGKAKSSTIPGENDMGKWYLAPRMYRTDGRNGGGIQLSFIGYYIYIDSDAIIPRVEILHYVHHS